MRRSIITIGLVALVLAVSVPSQAVVNTVAAVPGSGLAGFVAPRVVFDQSQDATFVNLDPVEPHNLFSVGRVGGPNSPRLFTTSTASGPGLQTITFNTTLTPGEYEFFCSVHAATMRGIAIVV